jgi:outer membrane protein, multidrug efflux system
MKRTMLDSRGCKNRQVPVLSNAWRAVAQVLLLAGLSACAPQVQLSQANPDRLSLSAPANLDAGGAVQDAHAVHWRQFFRDTRLHALIDAALGHNRDLRQALARVEEAKAQWTLAKAERQPNLQFLGQLALEKALAEGLSVAPRRRLDLGLATASYEFDFFGRLASLSDAAKANFLASEEARRATELALIGQVAELYHAQRFTEEALSRARAQVSSRMQSLDILERARSIGVIDDLETEQAQALLEEARAQRTQLGHVLSQTQHLIRFLVGPKAAADDLPEGLPADQLLVHPEAEMSISAEVLLLRPDIVAAEQRLRSSQASIKAARAAFFPRVALTASLGTASSGLENLFKAGAWAFRPSLSLPLFDGGRTQAQLDIALAREVQAVAVYERTIEQAFREVADQLAARHVLAVRVGSSQRGLQAHELRLKIHRQRYDAGMSGYLEVLEAERQVATAEQSLMQVRRAQLEAQVGLYRALGGGASVMESASAAPRVDRSPGS